MSKRLLLAGYFGAGNIGDDSILLGFLELLAGQGFEVTVMSGNPEETHRYYGVPAIPRKDMKAFNAAIESHDALVFPGGSIFQDASSAKSALFYSNLVRTAKKSKKKVILLGQGIGPLTTFFGKTAASKALGMCDAIAVRDSASISALKALGVRQMPRLCGDMAFLLPPPRDGQDAATYQVGNMRSVGLAPRPLGKQKEMIKLFGDLSRLLFQANYLPVLVEMDREEDGQLIYDIEKSQGGKVPSIRKVPTPMQMQQRIARMDALLAMRLHAGVLAATVGVPSCMVSYDPKVTAFAKQMDLPAALPVEGLTAERAFENFSQFMKQRDRYATAIARKTEEQKNLAKANLQVLLDCFGK